MILNYLFANFEKHINKALNHVGIIVSKLVVDFIKSSDRNISHIKHFNKI